MPPLFFIFLNVYFGKPKLQTWKIETAGLSVVTVGEGMPGCWQGLPVTLRQGIKMRGWLEEGPLWALSGKQNTFSLETRFSGFQGNHFWSMNVVERTLDRESGACGSISDLEADSSPLWALVYSSAKWKVARIFQRWEIGFSFSID